MNTLKNEFFNPSEEFSPIPFWFWNDRLTHKEIKRQIHDFNEKGVNGFVLHPRLGVPKDIEYLSDVFMDFVLTAVKEADELGMRDRKSTRLNSSHVSISYAVFCLKKQIART